MRIGQMCEIEDVITRHNELGKQIVGAGQNMFPRFDWWFDVLTEEQARGFAVTDKISIYAKWQDWTASLQVSFEFLEDYGVSSVGLVLAEDLAKEVRAWLLKGNQYEIHTARLELAKVGWY